MDFIHLHFSVNKTHTKFYKESEVTVCKDTQNLQQLAIGRGVSIGNL